MKKYWETETPIEVDTGKNILKYYSEAAKLQVLMPFWTDGNGEKKQSKTVTLNLTPLYEGDGEVVEAAKGIFENIVARIKFGMEV